MTADQVKLAALINANSSGYSGRGLSKRINTLSEELEGKKRAQELGLCRTTHDEYSINSGIEAIVRFNPEYLVLATGDGGVLFILEKLKAPYEKENRPLPKIIYLPTGRENRLGYELGYQDLSLTKKALRLLGYPESGYFKKPFSLLEDAVEDIKRGEVKCLSISLIEAILDGQKTILTFDVGFGLATNLILNYYGINPDQIDEKDIFRNIDHPRKKSDSFQTFGEAVFYSLIYGSSTGRRYLEKTIDSLAKELGLDAVTNGKLLKEVSPYQFTRTLTSLFHLLTYWERKADDYFRKAEIEIRTENKNYGNVSWLGGYIGTYGHIWKDFRPLYRAREDSHKMHFIGINGSMMPAALALKLPILYQGGPLGKDTTDDLTSHLEMKAARPIILQMAGEFYKTCRADLKVYDKEINFVIPQKRERKKWFSWF